MKDRGTEKKVTQVDVEVKGENLSFTPTAESKGKATQRRLFAGLAWLVAIAAEVGAIFMLRQTPINMVWLIVLIVVDLALAITGSVLWKQANRLDPASEKNKVKFFIQNQLGLIIAVIAFLPLIILVIRNEELDGKQKGIVAGVAIVALLASGIMGADFSPPSQEQYAQQTSELQQLTGQDQVYWTKSGTVYHIYSDCQHINTDKTSEIFQGTVPQARELKNITSLCKTCRARILKEKAESGTVESATEASTETTTQ